MKKAVVKKKGCNDNSDNTSIATGENVSRKLRDNDSNSSNSNNKGKYIVCVVPLTWYCTIRHKVIFF
jgi:hypothetical protein